MGAKAKREATPQLPAWRWIVTPLLIFHLAAVFAPPFALLCSSQESVSPVAAAIAGPLQPYIDFAYLNHGYQFFAPNPGPSHLVRWRLEFDDDRAPIEQIFPDTTRHWPRLLYHRHFMLAEQLNADFVPAEPPETDDKGQIESWRRRREVYKAKWQSYENQLSRRYAADRVTLVRVEHELPSWADVQFGGRRLDEEDSYIDLPETYVELPGPLMQREQTSPPEILGPYRP
jgi:hypothetical protein